MRIDILVGNGVRMDFGPLYKRYDDARTHTQQEYQADPTRPNTPASM